MKLTVRESEDEKVIEGYFAVFDEETQIYPWLYEKIDRAAFNNIGDSDVKCLVNHDKNKVLGRTKNETLILKVDDKGLYGEVSINTEDRDAMDIYAKVKRGDVDACSFGFIYRDTKCIETIDVKGNTHTTLTDVALKEVSIVTFPAYKNTSVGVRDASDIAIGKKYLLQKLKGVKK